jgi:hypothetical protein
MKLETQFTKDNNTWFMALVAIRYCIGRSTYAPSLAIQWVKDYWPIMPKATRAMIRRDVLDEIKQADLITEIRGMKSLHLGDPCDEEGWRNFANWLISRPAEDYAGAMV